MKMRIVFNYRRLISPNRSTIYPPLLKMKIIFFCEDGHGCGAPQ